MAKAKMLHETEPKNLTSRVDGSQIGKIQSGYVGDLPPLLMKKEPTPEELSDKEKIEKRVYQRILRQLIPGFPVKKLDKMTYEACRQFFEEEINPLIQEDIEARVRDVSP